MVCAHVKAWGVRFFMKWGRTGAATRCEQKRMKQLMAGGGIALVGATLIPLLSGLFG
ncbi:conjugal transfer protein [Hominisplanchenecus murintestinalis]|uniref:Conjugal transfer protein n=1 Tax=Hominisplanchenecus murintestinalis TaxID=2941517 RepID=A0AC61QWC2_9FIRM|nr:conjugal transfer protein [Hominisplanchenecus murintestinalis]